MTTKVIFVEDSFGKAVFLSFKKYGMRYEGAGYYKTPEEIPAAIQTALENALNHGYFDGQDKERDINRSAA